MRTTLRASSQALTDNLIRARRCGSFQPRGLQSLVQSAPRRWDEGQIRPFSRSATRHHIILEDTAAGHEEAAPTSQIRTPAGHDGAAPISQTSTPDGLNRLPIVCPGCGAHSQTVAADGPGFYDLSRPKNQTEARRREIAAVRQEEDAIFERAMKDGSLDGAISSHKSSETQPIDTTPISICDRCHDLLHQSRGTSIIHPSMQSIQDIIEESPHKHNHIYHVLDAADFPMSLIPNLVNALDLPKLRTQNRRSKTTRFSRGRVAEVSFIITRSDLLAPKKEQVDGLMPYLQEVLRDALGRTAKNIRLGNVRCVSATRGWWTKTVKEEIFDRGGAGWMVGKVNVGKSALFEVVFPKGRQEIDSGKARREAEEEARLESMAEQLSSTEASQPEVDAFGTVPPSQAEEETNEAETTYDESDDGPLLPPAQPETPYPAMPLVSSLPGTTASPIRIPFGSGKGELIDLPGIERSSLEEHIHPTHHKEMVMKTRVTPSTHTIKPGQSLLLGGLIRITPNTTAHDLLITAYPFVSPAFTPHVTGTHKAIAIQTGTHSAASLGREGDSYSGTVPSIATEAAKTLMKSAGTFAIKWDTTKRRAGPLTDRVAGKQKPENLPFTVYSTDILIEGVGWVELACQVRKRATTSVRKALPEASDSASINDIPRDALGPLDALSTVDALSPATTAEPDQTAYKPFIETDTVPLIPEVEVFTPKGKYIAQRRPMNAWLLGGTHRAPAHLRRERPRRSIGMVKRNQRMSG